MKPDLPSFSDHPHSPANALAVLAAALAPFLADALRRAEPAQPAEALPPAASPTQTLAFTVTSFCKAHEISTPTYYRLRKDGKGPREMRIGSEVRISVEAAADWRRAREEDSRP